MPNIIKRNFLSHWRGAVITLLFLALAAPQLTLPGPSNDEMDTVVLTMQMLLGLPSDAGYSVKFGILELPLMVNAYVGTATTYLLLPFFIVGGINIISVRAMTLTIGAATLAFTYLFLNDFYDHRVAWWTTALLATSPSFVFWNRIGVYPKTTALLAACAILFYLWRWYRGRGAGYLYGAMFALGIGISSHPIFIWFVLALIGSVVLIGGARHFPSAVDVRQWLIAGGSFLLSGWGVVWYNLVTGGTFKLVWRNARHTELYGVNNFAFIPNLLTQIQYLGKFVDGSGFADHGGVHRNPLVVPLFTGAVVGLLIMLVARRRTDYPSRRVWFSLLMTALVVLQSCFTITGFSTHHFTVIAPLPYLVIVLFLSELSRRSRAPVGQNLFRIVLAMLIGANLWVVSNYHRALQRSGGTGLVSDAVYNLAAYLQQRDITNPIAGDWGFRKNVQVLTLGRVNPLEIFEYSDQPGAAFRNRVRQYLFDPQARYLFHPSQRAVFNGHFAQLEALAQETGKELRVEKTFYERDGTPVYLLYVARRFTPPEIPHKLFVNLDDTVTLLGYDTPTTAAPGDMVRVTLYWQARAAPARDYTVFIHLLDAAGNIAAQVDTMPGNGAYPTTAWLPDEVVTDYYYLTVPAEIPSGDYRLSAGMYDAETMRRLPIGGGAGSDAVPLAKLTVIAQ